MGGGKTTGIGKKCNLRSMPDIDYINHGINFQNISGVFFGTVW